MISVRWGVNIRCDGMCVWGMVVSSEAVTDSQYVFDVLFSNTLKVLQWFLAAGSSQKPLLVFFQIKKVVEVIQIVF